MAMRWPYSLLIWAPPAWRLLISNQHSVPLERHAVDPADDDLLRDAVVLAVGDGPQKLADPLADPLVHRIVDQLSGEAGAAHVHLGADADAG